MKFKKIISAVAAAAIAVTSFAAASAAGLKGIAETGKYTYTFDGDDAATEINDAYAYIKVVGGTITSDGIKFDGTGINDSDKTSTDTIGENNKYILFQPKYSGNLNIEAYFENCDKSTARLYLIESSDASSFDELITKVNGLNKTTISDTASFTAAAETANKPAGAATASSKNLVIEKDHYYMIVPYSYKNSASTVTKLSYTSDDIIVPEKTVVSARSVQTGSEGDYDCGFEATASGSGTVKWYVKTNNDWVYISDKDSSDGDYTNGTIVTDAQITAGLLIKCENAEQQTAVKNAEFGMAIE